jgi:hypothetical protein
MLASHINLVHGQFFAWQWHKQHKQTIGVFSSKFGILTFRPCQVSKDKGKPWNH